MLTPTSGVEPFDLHLTSGAIACTLSFPSGAQARASHVTTHVEAHLPHATSGDE